MMKEKLFLDVNDVCSYMPVSKPKAYKIIRQLNDELNARGYLTVAGKVSRRYFEEKLFISENATEVQHAGL